MFKYALYIPKQTFIFDNAVLINETALVLGEALVLGDIISCNLTKDSIRIVAKDKAFLQKTSMLLDQAYIKFRKSIK